MQFVLKEVVQPIGGDRVRDDGGAGVVGREDGRHHGDQSIAADIRAIGKHGAHAVDIGIKYEAEICIVLDDSLLDRTHGSGILGVRDVVRKIAVRVEELAAGGVRTERGEDASSEESARTVAGIDGDVHPGKRLFHTAECLADFVRQVLTVAADKVELQYVIEGSVRFGGLARIGEDLLDVRLFCTARCGKEFESVAIVGEVARRDHDGAICCRVLEDGRHEHGGRRGKHTVNAVCAHVGEAGEDAVFDGERGDT